MHALIHLLGLGWHEMGQRAVGAYSPGCVFGKTPHRFAALLIEERAHYT
jgi:hypothetical protein